MKLLVIAILASLACACGSKDQGDKPGPERAPTEPQQVTRPPANMFPVSGVPVETFLANVPQIPLRLAATDLTLTFRSNVMPAVFECRTDRLASFRRCDGDQFRFDHLIHGRSYELEVRARDDKGRVDLSPLHLSFLVDHSAGMGIQDGLPGAYDVADLPPQMEASEVNSVKANINRTLGVGSFFSVAVPFEMVVTSFSTTKTYAGAVQIFHKLGEHAGSVNRNLPCGRGYDRESKEVGYGRYCEATPTTRELERDFASGMPRNHVELVAGDEPETDQKLFLAAFDHEADPARSRMGIGSTCRLAREHGTAVLPLWRDFYQRERDAQVEWCRVQDHVGGHWWIAATDAYVDASGSGPYLRVIYTVSAERGIVTRAQFLQQAAAFLMQVIVNTTPAER